MSYTHKYTKTIRIPYSGSVSYSYGPSQNGGSGTAYYSGTAVEEVEVDIYVDTAPFEASVESCNRHVDVLTGSVVATEAAQIQSIRAKGKQIGDTVVDGFFNTVKFEISTQIVELQKKVEAHLLQLHEMQKRLLALKEQMSGDYHHTTERYTKIFNELNTELSNRVHALDQPVFNVADKIYAAEDRFMESDILNVSTISGREHALLDAQINTAIAKSHARKALNEANTFLSKKLASEITLSKSIIDDERELKFYAPVCVANVVNEHNVKDNHIYAGDILPDEVSEQINEQMDNLKFREHTQEEKDNIDVYFNNLVNEAQTDDEHAMRIKNLISKLYSM